MEAFQLLFAFLDGVQHRLPAFGHQKGNQFLGHIRNVDAVILIARCFSDQDIPHPYGQVDPLTAAEAAKEAEEIAEAAADPIDDDAQASAEPEGA